jgi:hypothetical protein
VAECPFAIHGRSIDHADTPSDFEQTRKAFEKYKPSYVIHLAARGESEPLLLALSSKEGLLGAR